MAQRFVDLEPSHHQNQKPLSQHQELFLDILTKEEKEALLTSKIEGIRKKNEAINKRHLEVEADKKKAEALMQKDLKTQLKNKEGDSRDWHPRGPTREDNRDRRRPRGPPTEDNPNRKSWHGSSPYDRGENRKSWHAGSQRGDTERETREQPVQGKLSAGRGKRLANMSQEKLKAKDFERKKSMSPQKPQPQSTPTDLSSPPPDPQFSFLSDRSRDGNYTPQPREAKRHPRNYGGSEQLSNVAEKIKVDKSRGRGRGPPESKMDMAMRMTGAERRQYVEWKTERDKIDEARINRQKTQQGEWRREWDHDKVPQEHEERGGKNMKNMEPGKRPAGRIGSGRFDRGEARTDTKRGDNLGPSGQGQGRGMGHGGGSGRGRGRGQNEPQSAKPTSPVTSPADKGEKPEGSGRRTRVSSSGSDDRSVEKQNDSLVIKIDNNFVSPKKAFPSKPAGRGRGSHRDRDHKERERHPQRRAPSPKKNLKKLVINNNNKTEKKNEEIPPDVHKHEETEPDAEEIKRTVRETPERDLIVSEPAAGKAEADGFIEDDYITNHYEAEQEWPQTEDGENFYQDVPDHKEADIHDDHKEKVENHVKNLEEEYVNPDKVEEEQVKNEDSVDKSNDVNVGEDNVEYTGQDEDYECDDEFYEAEGENEPDTSAELHNISDTSSKQEEPSTPQTPVSDIMVKTPTGMVHVLDWGAEMDTSSGRSSEASIKSPEESPSSSQNPILKSSCIDEIENETPTNSREVSEEPVLRIKDDPEILRSPEGLMESDEVEVEDVIKSPETNKDKSLTEGADTEPLEKLPETPVTPKVEPCLSLQAEIPDTETETDKEGPSLMDELKTAESSSTDLSNELHAATGKSEKEESNLMDELKVAENCSDKLDNETVPVEQKSEDMKPNEEELVKAQSPASSGDELNTAKTAEKEVDIDQKVPDTLVDELKASKMSEMPDKEDSCESEQKTPTSLNDELSAAKNSETAPKQDTEKEKEDSKLDSTNDLENATASEPVAVLDVSNEKPSDSMPSQKESAEDTESTKK